MPEVYLASRRDFLLRTQNADGGWGYFPGKASWLEPTVYAMLALHGDADAGPALGRAWRLVESWQRTDGSFRAGAQVEDSSWATALAVTLCCTSNRAGRIFERAVNHLLLTSGSERCSTFRVMEFLGFGKIEQDTAHPAWPWRHGTSSWIEPTSHTLVALKMAHKRLRDRRLAYRIHEGEQMVLARRCADGGWNHGASATFHIDAPSYPESTGLALVGLQGRRKDAGQSLELARTQLGAAESPLASVWLAIAVQVWGESIPPADDAAPPGKDIMITALQSLAHPSGNHRLFQTQGAA